MLVKWRANFIWLLLEHYSYQVSLLSIISRCVRIVLNTQWYLTDVEYVDATNKITNVNTEKQTNHSQVAEAPNEQLRIVNCELCGW